MKNHEVGKIIGYSLLLMAIIAGIAYGYLFKNIYVPSNSQETLTNLKNFEQQFRIFIFLFIVILVLDILVSIALYDFFETTSKFITKICCVLRLVYSSLLGIAISCLIVMLQLIRSQNQNNDYIMNFLSAFLEIWSISLIVFGLHLLLLGYIIIKSKTIPNYIGIFTIVAAFCYILNNVMNILFKDYLLYKENVEMILSLPMALGELVLAFWLILKKQTTLKQSFF
ncbi:DUF4386 domain-containing protein [Flavobacterium geliluteum]|uniref:DUF4386 domain-containing protein n=1 Tax=Flavobacterium geliluteum TaxID=2816120 RepID=A0A940XF72_9FLAO|nr:DUF4386 domain-containing protein [Flavobacterium geliluteum]MBP4138620.1 DUF4386 domain-containing protein [Flavobacterium geliluteum]